MTKIKKPAHDTPMMIEVKSVPESSGKAGVGTVGEPVGLLVGKVGEEVGAKLTSNKPLTQNRVRSSEVACTGKVACPVLRKLSPIWHIGRKSPVHAMSDVKSPRQPNEHLNWSALITIDSSPANTISINLSQQLLH